MGHWYVSNAAMTLATVSATIPVLFLTVRAGTAYSVRKFSDLTIPSAPIEAGRIINIRFSIYSGTDRVRLNLFSKNRINRVLELELEHIDNDCRMF